MRRFAILASLIAIDFLTKAVALRCLSDHYVHKFGPIQFELYLNRLCAGSWAVASGYFRDPKQVVCTGLAYAVGGVGIVLMRGSPWSRWVRALVVLACFLVGLLAAGIGVKSFERIDTVTSMVVARVGMAVFWMSILIAGKTKLGRVAALLLSAAAVGNLVPQTIHPYQIVDFISVPAWGRVSRTGVFNLADVYADFGLVTLSAFLLRWLTWFAWRRSWWRARSASPAATT